MFDALTKPGHVLFAAAVLAAAAFTGAVWLVAVALASWLALAALDQRDRRPRPIALAPRIDRRLEAVQAAADALSATVASTRSPLPELTAEVHALVDAMEDHALRAQRILAFLDTRPRREREANPSLRRLDQRLDGLLAELDDAVAALVTLHAEVLGAELDQETAARQLSDLRANVEVVSESLAEAFRDGGGHP